MKEAAVDAMAAFAVHAVVKFDPAAVLAILSDRDALKARVIELERSVTAIAAAEREEAAKIADDRAEFHRGLYENELAATGKDGQTARRGVSLDIADAIRARRE